MTQATAGIVSKDRQHTTSASLSLRTLMAALIALFAFDNVMLLGLLGFPPALGTALAFILPAVLAFLIYKAMPGQRDVSARTIFICFIFAAVLLILGGEGRLFFAAADWQVRDAVLADMGGHRWPFDYWLDGQAQLLRAPVGMYLVPALLGGASQLGRDWALLAHNILILGLILALGSVLFQNRRARLIALAIFVMFSGLDVLGNLLRQAITGQAGWEHIERWSGYYQYSAHITQIFWVPQHAFAGWTVALTYLLWRKGLAPIGLFACSIPLITLWSPLAALGAVPFAMFAGIRALWTSAWKWQDVLTCSIAIMLAIPAILYLSTGAQGVGSGLRPPVLTAYVLIILLEVAPFVFPLLRDRTRAVDRATVLIAASCLFLMPFWSVGASNDFQMRASIMPLALIAIAFAEWASRIDRRSTKIFVLVLVALGSVTGLVEITRAIRYTPSPAPRCSLAGVWDRQTGLIVPHASYFAALEDFPFSVVPAARVNDIQPSQCWDHPWAMPRSAVVQMKARQ